MHTRIVTIASSNADLLPSPGHSGDAGKGSFCKEKGGSVEKNEEYPLPGHVGEVKRFDVSSDGLRLATAGDHDAVMVWECEGSTSMFKQLRTLPLLCPCARSEFSDIFTSLPGSG